MLAAKTSKGLIRTINTKMKEIKDDRDDGDDRVGPVVKGIIGKWVVVDV